MRSSVSGAVQILRDLGVDGATFPLQPLQRRLPGLPLGERDGGGRERRQLLRGGDRAIEEQIPASTTS